MRIGLGIILGSMLLVVAEGFASYYLSHNFFPSQVMARWDKAGIAFFTHGGMWGDLFLLPMLFGFVVTRYAKGWSAKQIVTMSVVGVLVTTGNHFSCIQSPVPDPLGWRREKWSTLIAMHFVYMSMYVTLAGLFYLSPGVSARVAVVVSVVLGVHTAFGTHVPLGLLNRWMQLPWCPDFFSIPVLPYLTAIIWITLSIFATIAAGYRAGFLVATIATGLATLVVLAIRISPPPVKFQR